MQQIKDWLEKLGLSEYARRFAENGINFAALHHLTDQDLKEIGVLLGHRRIMLAAIAELIRATESTAQPVVGSDAKPRDGAERRQVTVMFSDLVGSTALSARMDPEDLRDVISAYQHCVADIVCRFDGFVAKYMGDGVLVYFGYPQAHEDDAERAVRAGLEAIAAVRGLKSSVPLQTRIGIATGLVVVGDLIGSGEAQERGIVGQTPNLAARLQGIAQPNTVVIADGTRRLLGNLFELQDLGPTDLKGIAGPVRSWAAVRESSVASCFEAMHATGLTALVGRDEESELLLRRWLRAKTGDGQVVLLSGEAGIGKSRLTAALLERLAAEPLTRLRYFCSPQHVDSAFYPIIGQMQRAAGLTHDETPQARLDKLDAVLAQTSTSTQDATLFADMLSLPNDGRYPALELPPQQRRQRTLEALVSQLQALTRRNPVLMIFEDAHWSDPTSLEVLGRAVDVIATLPVLLIVTFRPEFEARWIGRPHVATLTLNRLTQRDVMAMIDRVVGSKPLPPSIRQDIIERTDGIPLFVEEMTKAVLEAGSEGEARRIAAAVPSPALAVPASLHASLMARLDRLGAAKEVAQIGAAIGREFSHALLAAVVGKPAAELGSALDRLIAAGLLFRQGFAPHESYLFKHALVQEAAYGTLLREPRRALHARIARALKEQFQQVAEMQPEILAHHLTQAGMSAEAVDFWTRAGVLARGRSAFAEAAAHLRRGLQLLLTLPESDARAAQELPIQIALGLIHMATRGVASVEAAEAYARARDICEQINDTDHLMGVLIGLRHLHQVQGKGLAARGYGAQCLDVAKRKGDRIFSVQANANLAHTLCGMGSFADARSHLVEALAGYDPNDCLSHRAISGLDPQSFCLGIAGWNEWFLGYPDRALQAGRQAVAVARSQGYPQSVDQALQAVAHTHLLRREPEAALNYIDLALAMSREHGFSMRIATARLMRGWMLLSRTDDRSALTELSEGLAEFRATGARAWQTNFLALLAIGCLRDGKYAEGLSTIAEAQSLARAQDEYWWEPELHRLEGDLLLTSAGLAQDRVEQCYKNALESARRREAKSWELRAAMSMARLWRDQGKRDEARELLAPIYGWFTEGFDTLDLKRAKALLDELAVACTTGHG
jgi:class 3 adenylate cyclase/predicted ATPase